jgi:hypothetical protein
LVMTLALPFEAELVLRKLTPLLASPSLRVMEKEVTKHWRMALPKSIFGFSYHLSCTLWDASMEDSLAYLQTQKEEFGHDPYFQLIELVLTSFAASAREERNSARASLSQYPKDKLSEREHAVVAAVLGFDD